MGRCHVTSGVGAPSDPPLNNGDHYTDTSTGDIYLSNDTNWVLQGTGTDINVKISSDDTTTGFLFDKTIATEGTNTTNILELYEDTPAGDENLEYRIDQTKISITESQISDLSHTVNTDENIKVSSNDTTAKYLEDAVVATEGTNTTNILEITTLNDGADEDLQLQIDQTKISITESQISDLTHTTDTFAAVELDGVAQSTGAPTLDFDGTDFAISESPTDSFDITVKDSGIDHDATTNFVANEHIDWTAASAGTIDPTNYVDNNTQVIVEDEGTPLTTAVTKINFAGAGVTATEPATDEILVTIPGATGGHTIQEETVSFTQRTNLDFGPGFDIVDNAGNDATEVTLDLSEVLPDAAYGSLKFDGVGGAVSMDLDVDVWTKIAAFNSKVDSGAPIVVADSTTDKITVGVDGVGTYHMTYSITFTSNTSGEMESAIYKNGTRLEPSRTSINSSNGQKDHLAGTCMVAMSSTDYFELFVKSDAANQDPDIEYAALVAVKASGGAKGETGDPGSGSTIVIKDEGIAVAGAPHDTLDFAGLGVTVTDGTAGRALITIPGNTTHTGEVTGASALTVGKTAISNQTLVTAAVGDHILIGDASDTDSLKKVTVQTVVDLASSSIFGASEQEASSDGTSTTTSVTYVQKIRMTTPSLTSGDYRIGYSYEWNMDATNRSFSGRVQINDTTTISEITQQPSTTTAWHTESAIYYHTGSGVLDIDIDFLTSNATGTASIRRARLEIWRVS